MRANALVAYTLCALISAGMSHATNVSAYDSGWVRDDGFAVPLSTNTYTGFCDLDGCFEYPETHDHNSYYLFDLATYAGNSVTSAMITFAAGHGWYDSQDASETLGLFDVLTSNISLLEDGTSDVPGYTDLGSGDSYGTTSVGSGPGVYDMPEVSVVLNSSAIDNLNALLAGVDFKFGVGASLLSLSGQTEEEEALWSGSPSFDAIEVTLSLEMSQVPLPATLPLVAAAIAGLGVLRRRKI